MIQFLIVIMVKEFLARNWYWVYKYNRKTIKMKKLVLTILLVSAPAVFLSAQGMEKKERNKKTESKQHDDDDDDHEKHGYHDTTKKKEVHNSRDTFNKHNKVKGGEVKENKQKQGSEADKVKSGDNKKKSESPKAKSKSNKKEKAKGRKEKEGTETPPAKVPN